MTVNTDPYNNTPIITGSPDQMLSVRKVFGIDSDIEAPAFSERTNHVPE